MNLCIEQVLILRDLLQVDKFYGDFGLSKYGQIKFVERLERVIEIYCNDQDLRIEDNKVTMIRPSFSKSRSPNNQIE